MSSAAHLLPYHGVDEEVVMHIKVSSSAFGSNMPIPRRFSGEGSDISPPLRWSGAREIAKELALICEDADAPEGKPLVHWVMYGIPAECNNLPEGVRKEKSLKYPAGAVQGMNSFGQIGYNGPKPPPGTGVHSYHFRLYAVGKKLNLQPGLDKKQLLAAIKKHIVDEGEFVGTYGNESGIARTDPYATPLRMPAIRRAAGRTATSSDEGFALSRIAP